MRSNLKWVPKERFGNQVWDEWRGGQVANYAEAAASSSSAAAAEMTPEEVQKYWQEGWSQEWHWDDWDNTWCDTWWKWDSKRQDLHEWHPKDSPECAICNLHHHNGGTKRTDIVKHKLLKKTK